MWLGGFYVGAYFPTEITVAPAITARYVIGKEDVPVTSRNITPEEVESRKIVEE